ncbi:hypothetical protein COCC4DRAFT_34229, partial [Bipolaris maydis ATCC 48331]
MSRQKQVVENETRRSSPKQDLCFVLTEKKQKNRLVQRTSASLSLRTYGVCNQKED